jgi:hypothetical protein
MATDIKSLMSAAPTGIEAAVCDDIARRQAIGLAKYGMTVANNPLPLRAWLRHAYEEMLDQAVYLKRAMAELEGRETIRDGSGDALRSLPANAVVAATSTDTGHPLLQRLIDSLEVVDGSACWDYAAMYEVRDALNGASPERRSCGESEAAPAAAAPSSEPTTHDLIVALRDKLGLFSGAMPISPREAWEEALAMVTSAPSPEPATIRTQDVLSAIYAVDREAAWRGEMFPQTSDEQLEDRRAVARVMGMIKWYEKNTGCDRIAGWPGRSPELKP